MRRSANIFLAAVLVAVAVVGGVVARALPTSSGPRDGSRASAGEPYTSRWLCPVIPQVKGELTVANTGTRDALLRATMRWDGSSNGVVEPPKTTEPPPTTKPPPGDGGEGTGTTKAPATTVAPTTTTRPPATTAAGAVAKRSRPVATGEPLKPGDVRTLSYGQADKVPGLLELESFGAPVAVNGTGQPACVPEAATRWWLPTADVPQGGDTRVIVANPGEEGATVRVTLHTAVTRYDPSGLKQLFIPGRSARMLSVNRWLGASAEQSVQVQALFGTVVVGALTTRNAKDRNPAIVPAQWGGHDRWAFAGGLSGEAGQTSLLLTNPGDTTMRFEVDVVTDKQTVPLPDAENLEVPAGTMQSMPVTVDVDGPIGLLVRSRTGDPFGAGLRVTTNAGLTYVDGGGSGEDERWVLPKAGGPPIAVANYGDKPLRFSIDGLTGGHTGEGGDLAPGRIAYLLELPKIQGGLMITSDRPGLVVRTASDLQAVPGEWIGGLPVAGVVRPGPAAG
jgi:hypothetical protein